MTIEKQFENHVFDGYWKNSNPDGTFKKGNKIGIKTQIKTGEHLSPHTEFKKGNQHPFFKHGNHIAWHREARKIVEEKLGRKLTHSETVHHIDGNMKNNAIENLSVFDSHSAHMTHHWQIQKSRKLKGRMKKSGDK